MQFIILESKYLQSHYTFTLKKGQRWDALTDVPTERYLTDGQIDVLTDTLADTPTNTLTDALIDALTDAWLMLQQTARLTDRETDWLADWQLDRWKDY